VANFTKDFIAAVLVAVSWPTEAERRVLRAQCQDMHDSHLAEGTIGAIDGSFIRFRERPCFGDKPKNESYCNYKSKAHGMNLTVIADLNCVIREFHVGTPGSRHDAYVWKKMEQSTSPADYFLPDEFILGDSAYPLTTHCLVPYKTPRQSSLTSQKKEFNRQLSSIRVKVEHTFGILKHKFQSLRNLPVRISSQMSLNFAVRWIAACIVLHNKQLEWQGDEYATRCPAML